MDKDKGMILDLSAFGYQGDYAQGDNFDEIQTRITIALNELDLMKRLLWQFQLVVAHRERQLLDWNLTRKKLFELAQSWVNKKVRFGDGVMLVTCIRLPYKGCCEDTLFIVDGSGENMRSSFEFRFFSSRFLGFVDEK